MTDDTPDFIIAVVDDDQRVLESLQTLLESANYGVRVFASGPTLLESGCVAKIDGLVSDVAMPEMDGFELSRRIRAVRPTLPIILITGHAAMWKLAPPDSLGDYRLLEKPFDGVDLLAVVADALRNTWKPQP
jgi:FixJ family two-component response regulator